MLHDDDISLFGTSGIIFCINNKEQHIGQKEMLQILKSYPASDVEKIEIIQTPGAEYSAAGNAGVINLILKKKGNDYIGGSIGYAHTQYEEHGDEANANVIYNKGKVSTSLNVAGIWDNTRYKETNTLTFEHLIRDNIDNGHIRKNNYSARWQIDYDASTLNAVDILRILMGQRNDKLPVVIPPDAGNNVFVYWSGHGRSQNHGGAREFQWRETDHHQGVTAQLLYEAVTTMQRDKSFRKLFILAEP